MADKEITTQMNELEVAPTTKKDVLGYFVPQAEIQKIEPHGITIRQALQNQLTYLERKGKNEGKTEKKIRQSQRPYIRAIDILETVGEEGEGRITRDMDLAVLNNPSSAKRLNQLTLLPALSEGISTEEKRKIMGARVRLFSSLATIVNRSRPDASPNALLDLEKRMVEEGHEAAYKREAYQRTKRKIALPKFKEYSKALFKGIQKIEDKQVRAFAALKLMTGLRDTEFPRILTEASEDGAGYWFDPDLGTVKFYNKGSDVIDEYHLGTNATEILKELQEDAKKEGRTHLFSKSEDTLRNNGVKFIRKALDEAGLPHGIDRKTGKKITFTFGNLRKNLFDAALNDFGKDVANTLLGHSVNEIGMTHYAIDRIGDVSEAGEAVDNLFRKFGVAIERYGPRSILESWKFDKAAKNVSEVFPNVTIDSDTKKLVDLTAKTTDDIVFSVKGAEDDLKELNKRLSGTTKQVENLKRKFESIPSTQTIKKEKKVPFEGEDLGKATGNFDKTPVTFEEALRKGVVSQAEVDEVHRIFYSGNKSLYLQKLVEIDDRLLDYDRAQIDVKIAARKAALKKLAVGAATTAIGMGVTGGAKAAETILDLALSPTPMGGTVDESVRDEELLTALETGKPIKGSSSLYLTGQEKRTVERELQDRERAKRRAAMAEEAQQYTQMHGAPPPSAYESFGKEMDTGFARATREYEDSPFYRRYAGYFIDRPSNESEKAVSGQPMSVQFADGFVGHTVLEPPQD